MQGSHFECENDIQGIHFERENDIRGIHSERIEDTPSQGLRDQVLPGKQQPHYHRHNYQHPHRYCHHHHPHPQFHHLIIITTTIITSPRVGVFSVIIIPLLARIHPLLMLDETMIG